MKAFLSVMGTVLLLQASLKAQNDCEERPVYLNPPVYENSRIIDPYDIESDNLRNAYPSNHDSSFYDLLTR